MDNQTFEKGFDVGAYVANLRNYRSFVRERLEEARADDRLAEELRRRASEYPQPVRATVTTEDWCGDSALNLPILASLFEKAGIELRVFRGSELGELKERYEADGDDHIPVLSLWDSEWNELGRWIEAPSAIEPKKNAWKAKRPHFMELYAQRESDRDAAKRFAALYRDFLSEMAQWYRDGMWEETQKEIVDLLG